MKILVIDVGGTHVKMLATGVEVSVNVESGKTLTPATMIEAVTTATASWKYDVITLGVPAPVRNGRILRAPLNLGDGWLDFDFSEAFGKPVRMVNDAVMQALGSYSGGSMLFLGLGTGLGAAVINEGHIQPLEIAHLSYRKATYEHYLGVAGLKRAGRKTWERRVHIIAESLRLAMVCDSVVLGGGNAKKLNSLPPNATLGSNANAFVGGFRLWNDDSGMTR